MRFFRSDRDPRRLMLGVALVTLFAIGLPTRAQPDSPAAMRERIATLEGEVAQLKTQLESAVTERDRLKAEIEQLRQAMVRGRSPSSEPTITTVPAPRQTRAQPGEDGSPQAVPMSALSREPLDSPDALFVALLLDYRESLLGDAPDAVKPAPDAVKAWIDEASKTYEGTTDWLVRIDGIVEDRKGPAEASRNTDLPRRMLVTVLDPASAKPISRPAMITIPRRFDARFPDRLASGEVLYADMRVKMEAACVHQPGRLNEGPFNYPPFLGPHAGFGYTIDIVGLKFETYEDIRDRMRAMPTTSDR